RRHRRTRHAEALHGVERPRDRRRAPRDAQVGREIRQLELALDQILAVGLVRIRWSLAVRLLVQRVDRLDRLALRVRARFPVVASTIADDLLDLGLRPLLLLLDVQRRARRLRHQPVAECLRLRGTGERRLVELEVLRRAERAPFLFLHARQLIARLLHVARDRVVAGIHWRQLDRSHADPGSVLMPLLAYRWRGRGDTGAATLLEVATVTGCGA